MDEQRIREVLHRLFVAAPGTRLRREDLDKAAELAGFLEAMRACLPRRGAPVVVDAAAGRSSVGLTAVELLGLRALVVIERDPGRADACRDAATRLEASAHVDVRCADVADLDAWPAQVHLAVALHACGPGSDGVLRAAMARRARWILLAPCCYADAVPFAAGARAIVASLGIPRHAAVRRPMIQSLVDAERTLQLEAGGYDVTVSPFAPQKVTPHNLLWRARHVGDPTAMRAAAERLGALHARASAATTT